MRTVLRRGTSRWPAVGLGLALALALSSASAQAAVPFVDLGAASGPLNRVVVGNDLSCQIQHTGDSVFEMYPSGATPGDCGTLLVAGGALYAPDFENHDSTATSGLGTFTPFTAGSQSAKSGNGSAASPFRVVTTATAGATGLTITETDSYVSGQESYRTDVAVRNAGGAAQSIILYRAGDCYLQESDRGFGFTGPNNAVGCSANANNTPAGRIEEWVPITGGNNFVESGYSDVWSIIGGKMPFPNLCKRCTESIDNGAGISWNATIQPGQTSTFSHFTTFSPTGRTGPPAPPSVDLDQARNPVCLSIPPVTRNRIGRVPGLGQATLRTLQVDNPAQPLRLAASYAGRGAIATVTFVVNGRRLSTGARRSVAVPKSNLRIGSRFRNLVVATVVLTSGRTVRLTQFLVILKCSVPPVACQRLPGNKRMRCSSRTPGIARRASVTVTRSAAETARGSAVVVGGRYTVTVTSRTALGAGVYAYKAVIRTNKPGERLQMIRRVTVR